VPTEESGVYLRAWSFATGEAVVGQDLAACFRAAERARDQPTGTVNTDTTVQRLPTV